ncbi:MAG TPA: hypothetical protein VF395_09110, partial [Polyangiaceae bacterium]
MDDRILSRAAPPPLDAGDPPKVPAPRSADAAARPDAHLDPAPVHDGGSADGGACSKGDARTCVANVV